MADLHFTTPVLAVIDFDRARRLPGAALLFFNISTLAKGVYFLKIGTDRATVVRKIVVE